jgi:hypothetical protein
MLVELCWERYRRVRQKLLESHHQRAIEYGLRQFDLAGITPDRKQEACEQISRNAAVWRIDANAASEI